MAWASTEGKPPLVASLSSPGAQALQGQARQGQAEAVDMVSRRPVARDADGPVGARRKAPGDAGEGEEGGCCVLPLFPLTHRASQRIASHSIAQHCNACATPANPPGHSRLRTESRVSQWAPPVSRLPPVDRGRRIGAGPSRARSLFSWRCSQDRANDVAKPRARRWQHWALLSWPHGTTTGANGSGGDRVVGDALTRVRTGSTATALEDGPFRRPTSPSPAAGSDPLSKCPEPGLAWKIEVPLNALSRRNSPLMAPLEITLCSARC
ncbi:hypothetical protein OIDMADRAFT_28035 [Oidiodendron maius Zn]|uniref:Uncharacterized protein n=1 Tax=Oidiodendron maius (strain Zn) TaxID=913774 RepID=A0A0C3HHS5_OIDMZ|nr:hypothetical protein OIDMADRAFT_28035 [Oidiodendron maius Zn]